MIDFKAVRATHPIADVVNRYLPLTRRGSEFVARCPFHNEVDPRVRGGDLRSPPMALARAGRSPRARGRPLAR